MGRLVSCDADGRWEREKLGSSASVRGLRHVADHCQHVHTTLTKHYQPTDDKKDKFRWRMQPHFLKCLQTFCGSDEFKKQGTSAKIQALW